MEGCALRNGSLHCVERRSSNPFRRGFNQYAPKGIDDAWPTTDGRRGGDSANPGNVRARPGPFHTAAVCTPLRADTLAQRRKPNPSEWTGRDL